MQSLKALQELFCRDLLSESKDGDFPYILEHALTAASCIEIYRHNVFHNYHQTLSVVYPVIERLVGAAFFKNMAYQYIRLYPSSSGDLNDYGAFFAQFLRGCAAVESLAYLPDVACLEWAIEKVFYAASHQRLSLVELQKIPPDQYGNLHFQLHPATALIRSTFPILAIWQANQPEARGDRVIDLALGEEFLLIYRDHFSVAIRKLSRAEFVLLDALRAGCSVSDAYICTTKINEDFDVLSFLKDFIALNVLVSYSLPVCHQHLVHVSELGAIKT